MGWRSVSAELVGLALTISLTLPLFIFLTLPSPPFADLEPALKTAACGMLELNHTIWCKKIILRMGYILIY